MKRLIVLNIIFACLSMTSSPFVLANEDEEFFDSRFIFTSSENKAEDKDRISRYLESGGALPGKYNVKFYVNEAYVGQAFIEIKEGSESTVLCKNSDILFSRKVTLVPEAQIEPGIYDCGEIEEKLNARWELDSQTLALSYIIPNKYIDDNKKSLEQRVEETQVDGLLFNYDLSYNDYDKEGGEMSGSLTAQGNVGRVRFYADTYYSESAKDDKFDFSQAYIATPIYSIESELKLGDTYTSGGTLMSGFPIRGVSITSDSDMWSESHKRFIIPVTGTVSENSTIKFYYNDTLLATRHVESGPYSFNDIYPPGSGDLKVVEEGQSGRKTVRIISIPSRSSLLPSGTVDFNFSLGNYRYSDNKLGDSVAFFNLGYGLGYITPTFTSVVAEGYYSNEIAVATVGPLGSDIEVNLSHSSYEDSNHNLAYAIKFNQDIYDWLGLNINYYKYLDRDYLTFSEYQSFKDSDEPTTGYYDSRLYLSLNMQVGYRYLNSINLSYSSNEMLRQLDTPEFDTSDVTTESYNVSLYGGLSFYDITYTLTASTSKSFESGDYEPSVFLSFNIPLRFDNDYVSLTSVDTYINRDKDGHYTSGASASGMINQEVNYLVSSQTDWEQNETNSTLTLQGHSNYNQFYGSVSENNLYVSAGGSLGYTRQSGIVASSSRGENPTLVKLGELEGIEQFGTKTNSNGYLMTSNSAYNEKELKLDVGALSGDIYVASSRETFTQGKGTFSVVSFSAEKTINYYMKIHRDGELLEPGALVKTANGYTGYVSVDHSVLISERVLNEMQSTLNLTINSTEECQINLANKDLDDKISSRSKVFNLGDVNCE
ncbi:TPA: fimbria/pilus outer membrane usher protein [Vibrio cholerae]|uniref:fimbria/pilus outer membrane usher protein n=1 Tax=Vibrio cholerae TaxID=666 RepID=UPI00164553AF|nr:fimbria/pilus outer membrane usher protein [Vibrio cholerae]